MFEQSVSGTVDLISRQVAQVENTRHGGGRCRVTVYIHSLLPGHSKWTNASLTEYFSCWGPFRELLSLV